MSDSASSASASASGSASGPAPAIDPEYERSLKAWEVRDEWTRRQEDERETVSVEELSIALQFEYQAFSQFFERFLTGMHRSEDSSGFLTSLGDDAIIKVHYIEGTEVDLASRIEKRLARWPRGSYRVETLCWNREIMVTFSRPAEKKARPAPAAPTPAPKRLKEDLGGRFPGDWKEGMAYIDPVTWRDEEEYDLP